MVSLSVVIPTYNRVKSLERVLAGLARQALPATAFEVVVVSDGATDGTAEFLSAAQLPFQLALVNQTNQGPAAARNHGVARAQADIIVFLDDDVVPTPPLLSEHLRAHEVYGRSAVVIGPMLPPPDQRLQPWVRWSQERLGEQYRAMQSGCWAPTARQFYTGNTSLARSHLVSSGGFDETFKRAEDVELAYRLAALGLQFVFSPAAIGYHYEQRSFAAWLAIPYHYGRSDVVFTREKGQTWLLPTVLNEYRGRPAFVRIITRLCLDRPRLRQWATLAFRRLALWGHGLNLSLLVRLACSSLFNLYHYQGIADGLGGRQYFFAAAAGVPADGSAPGRLERPSL